VAITLWQLPLGSFGPVPAGFGSLASLGVQLFTTWGMPFELVSLVLTVAMVGAVALAKRRLDG
ncbi:MAG: NADH-quinone oxidoreductase subunit J, partial [Cyanobacteria bacterium REEB65]|nr:NADH-quinone oxidoreductase subunit J [Cyanobacteria bacterium REEB65]